MNPDGFLADVLEEPATLRRVLEATDHPNSPVQALQQRIEAARLVVLIGMGSSRFAALTAAAHLRSRGIAAVAEYASTDAPTAPGPDVLAIGISATGNSAETIQALQRHANTAAITNGGQLGTLAGLAVPLNAGTEAGGVACKTFQATLAVLLRAAGATTTQLAPAIQAQQDLIDARDAWLPPLLDLLADAHTVYTIAPAARISSALQSALMFREGPRIPADATETGDWSHVDVYLTKHPNYTALMFGGSPWDDEALTWIAERRSRIIAIGPPIPGATLHIPHTATDPLTAALVDVTVAELAAATWWRRRIDEGTMP